MDTILIVLGVIGLCAVVVSAYVFTVAARHYVSDDEFELSGEKPGDKELTPRSPVDRRRGLPVNFPLQVNGDLIPRDRRQIPERRMRAA